MVTRGHFVLAKVTRRHHTAGMPVKFPADREVIEKIGDDALIAEGIPPHCVKAWKYRGVPWAARAKVARIAKARRVKIPSNFAEERAA